VVTTCGDRRLKTAAAFALVGVLMSISIGATSAQSGGEDSYSRDNWLADYSYLKRELERSYSHLAWFGSPEGGVDLRALDRATRRALERARDSVEASAAITTFLAGFHDGHLAPTVVPKTPRLESAEPPVVDSAADARTGCAAFGYAPVIRVAFSLPFESLPGFRLVSDGLTDAFRSGVINQDGRRIGIMRIPRFRPAEYPQICESAWASLTAQSVKPTRSALLAIIDVEWLRTLSARLGELCDLKVAALLVDVGGNGGGNDLGDWAVRLFTREPVYSAPLLLSAGPVAIPYYDEQLADLNLALNSDGDLPGATRSALEQAIADFNRWKETTTKEPCDMSWAWREQRPWGASPSTRLIASGFASGWIDYAGPGTIDPRAARALYWPSVADSFRGSWTGPTYVLTDTNTGSAAEMFVALMQDRGIAKIIGTRTHGLGGGFMDYDDPVVLPHSKLAFKIPNCARLRADGTDEVAGIAPDLQTLAQPGETARSIAARALRMVANDLTPGPAR
jgi:hypothetical protein